MYERGTPSIMPAVAAIGLCGISLGLNIGILVEKSSDDGDSRVKLAQDYNAELQRQLQAGDRVVAHLMVDDEGQHYSFNDQNQLGQTETCRGDFQIKHDVAKLAGDVTCTTSKTVKVG